MKKKSTEETSLSINSNKYLYHSFTILENFPYVRKLRGWWRGTRTWFCSTFPFGALKKNPIWLVSCIWTVQAGVQQMSLVLQTLNLWIRTILAGELRTGALQLPRTSVEPSNGGRDSSQCFQKCSPVSWRTDVGQLSGSQSSQEESWFNYVKVKTDHSCGGFSSYCSH